MCIKFYQKYQRLITGAVITVGVILLGTFVPSETEYSKRKDRAISFSVVLLPYSYCLSLQKLLRKLIGMRLLAVC